MSVKSISILDVSETLAIGHRTLPDGSTLEYRMQVLQQPERARACGMGAKSHADRRPVDPPPVVELRLFQGPDKADVTFSHNSNFFLFATLEQARPIAQGRGMPTAAPAPVLTGVPVSGMAYLDRPNPAGYFIFPDLSVRHEGKYRLRFALYEETKDEMYPVPADPQEPREWCAHRLDVKSKPFTVFSAKKFPGLAESTALSRIVAEQGCRVRIRRDVRMRRRSDRPSRDSEERMAIDETARLRAARRGGTPDQYDIENSILSTSPPPPPHPMQRSDSIDRKRSGSDASVMSMTDVAAVARYDGGYTTPHQTHGPYGPPTGPPNAHHHIGYGSGHSNGAPPVPQGHAPQQMFNQQMQPRYPQQHVAPQHHPSPNMAQTPRPQQPQYAVPGYHAHDNSSIPSQQTQTNGHHVRRESGEYRARRDSESSFRAPSSQFRPSTPMDSQYNNGQTEHGYGQKQQQAYQATPQYQTQQIPPSSGNNGLSGIRLPPLEPKLWSNQPSTPSATPPSNQLLPSPTTYQAPNVATQQKPASAQFNQIPPPPTPAQFPNYYPEHKFTTTTEYTTSKPSKPEEPPKGTKRSWGRVFNNNHVEGPMRDRMRPSSSSSVYGSDANPYAVSDVDDEAYDLGRLKMTYRRADGVEIVRKLPGEDD
ncbi:hypothetical protein RUND412_005008 [Rhizina undulata]